MALFQQSRRARILEKRSAVLSQLLLEHSLPEPKSVEFAPLRGCDYKRCFVNVDRQVADGGGRLETGWIFWEVEDTCVYTEAHAVWITPQGRRQDITPQKLPPERRILFLPDERVAAKRGITTGYSTVLSTDPRVVALERFRVEMSRAIEAVFPGFGVPYAFPVNEILLAADRIGVPPDVAEALIQQKIQENNAAVERFGT